MQLTGDWSLEAQWAFYQGFINAKRFSGVNFTGDAATVNRLQQLVRCYSFARGLINQTPEQLSPELLCQQAAAFISNLG